MSYGGWPMGELADVWSNNTCITQGVGRSQMDSNSCNQDAPTDGSVPLFSNNRYANPEGNYSFHCGKATWSLAEAQAHGVDVGSVIAPLPSTADIIAAGHALLEF